MKLVRFLDQGRPSCGILRNDDVVVLEGGLFPPFRERTIRLAASVTTLLAPCVPSKIIAVGLNYRDHAEELGMPVPEEPVLFLKPPTCVIGPGESIRWPAMSNRVDYEAELGVVIKDR
ncbi:MAG TPA: fumarylacetoacetate hydrolase family protein, partial [Nitrospirota bacterium]|nr:fumarylacetoacetate hydrolase family protein [Nitrospirota bacterium]